MEIYEKPELEITRFDVEDVIVTSISNDKLIPGPDELPLA